MIKKETDRQNYSILAGEGAILRILKEIDKAKNSESIGAGIQKLLEVLGNYGNADRTYLFETVHTPETFTNTYEWCAEGITAQRDNLQDVKFEEMPCWVKKFRQGESVVVNNIEDICHTMPLEYELLKMKAIKSVVVLPLFHGSYLTGFLGLDNPYIQENENFIFFLELIGAHLGSALVNTLVEQNLKQKTKELEHKNMFLDTLCQEYTSVYYVDLDAGVGEVIKVDSGANAAKFIKAPNKTMIAYMPMLKAYAESYVIEEDRDYFLARLETHALKEELLKEERVSFRYRSLPNSKTHKCFEVHAIRANGTDQNSFGIMVAFRYVDDIIKQEQKIQKALEKTLEESRISNSIVSAIGKIYFSLYRIVLENDQYEEISAEQEIHRLTGKVGLASEKMKEICDNFVCQEHYDMVLKFFDLSTLADRLKNDDTTALEYKAKDGNWHLARFIVKIRNEEGRAIHVLYVTRIISETKRREESLALMAERAKRESEAKTDFLSQVSHDIRTPLNAVRGFTRIARENIDNKEKVRHGLAQIDIASNYLQQIVNDVLDLSRIEKGKLNILMEEMSVSEVFSQFRDTILEVMPDKHQQISCRLKNIEYDRIILDELRLKQIYMNLLSNAIKYTPDGGQIVFEVKQEKSDRKGYIRLVSVIQDSGIGMTKEYMEKMYDRFSRAVDTRVNQIRGSGLGLSVVKELTVLMEGTITAKSAVGEGTVFTVSFDVEYIKEAKEKISAKPEKKFNKLKRIHLLVAEDNDLNYEVEQELLGMYGITCERAENGKICVDKFHRAEPKTYDAILMDMQMPVMDGIDAAKHIRQMDSESAEIPIIAVTANAFKSDEEYCAEAGMNAHLSKPFDINKLMEVLTSLLDLEYTEDENVQ